VVFEGLLAGGDRLIEEIFTDEHIDLEKAHLGVTAIDAPSVIEQTSRVCHAIVEQGFVGFVEKFGKTRHGNEVAAHCAPRKWVAATDRTVEGPLRRPRE
jgi:hypothetical protein